MNLSQRRSGVVLHFSSLPGPHGSGDFGTAAMRFADWLASAGQTLWQTLPTTPIGPGDSPYQSISAFAGNPLLVALAPLIDRGWLAPPDLDPGFDPRRVAFSRVVPWRHARLREAAAGFARRATRTDRDTFAAWRAAQQHWLPDFTLYLAVKESLGLKPWWAWPLPLRKRDPAALHAAQKALTEQIESHAFVQWCFDTQLAALKSYANARGVLLMGDMPIFVAHDSADVWSRPDLVRLDAHDQPAVVAGVPPDSYTPDGQRWGNPLYRWDRMADENYAWWTARMRRLLDQADVFRLDHFRGFAGCWEIPAACPTAREGQWVPGPGAALFDAIEAALGARHDRLPIVAEDLGTITPDVVALRQRFGFPGMRIVYEGFMHGAGHPFLPHRHTPAGLAYTSTHDSDTVRGWWDAAPPEQREFATAYLGDTEDIAWAVLRATLTSVSSLALATMQDLLGLGSEHRMNRPGTGAGAGNWTWRFDWPMLPDGLAVRLRALTRASGRDPAWLS